jgi:tight adherence protein B
MGIPGTTLQRRVEDRLQQIGLSGEGGQDQTAAGDLIKTRPAGPLPAVDRVAGLTSRGFKVERWIQQSGAKMSISAVLLTSFGSGTGIALLAWMLVGQFGIAFAAGVAGLVVPVLVLRKRRRDRLYKFEERFPEALDLISRAIRAGHAFSAALKMVADELDDPVGPEFRETFDEQNFGLPLKDALNNLSDRVPILDVRFFAIAVLIQRETGGNLSEILDNLAHVVRERFKILREVQVHTAHGRLTGYVLVALPAVLVVALLFINPDQVDLLFRERMGQMMLTGAIVLQIIGYVWIKQVVKIEV